MPTDTSSAQAELLVELILRSEHLSDDQKNAALTQIFEGTMPDTLSDSLTLDAFLAQEQTSIQGETEELQDALNANEALLKDQESEILTGVEAIAQEHEQETAGIKQGYFEECSRIERSLNQDAEGIVRTNKDDTEADAIRNMLKQKPDGK